MAENKEKKQSILEQALLEASEIQKTAESNAKEILAKQMRPEIERIVKESIEKEDSVDETKMEESHDQQPVDEEKNKVKENEDEDNDLEDIDSEKVETDLEDDIDSEKIEDKEPEEISDDEEGIEQVDLTSTPDEDVVKVFKKMTKDDQIEIEKDGDSIKIKDEDKEYRIELSESKNKGKLNEDGVCEECPDNDLTDDDSEMIYEIEIEGKDNVSETDGVSEKVTKDEELEETFNVTHAEGKNVTSKPQNFNVRSRPGDTRYKKLYQEAAGKNKQLVEKFNSLRGKAVKILNENKELKEFQTKLKNAVVDMRGKLNEVALFNSNLAYANRIMAEETTTRKEKIDMIQRFDKVKSIKESKQLYKTLLGELKKEPIKESVEKKITKTSESSSSKQINESKVYSDPQLENQIKRMKDLMNYSTNGK